MIEVIDKQTFTSDDLREIVRATVKETLAEELNSIVSLLRASTSEAVKEALAEELNPIISFLCSSVTETVSETMEMYLSE